MSRPGVRHPGEGGAACSRASSGDYLAYCYVGQQWAEETLRCEESVAAAPEMPRSRALRTQIRAIVRDKAA
ncbi:MAG TPA: hypothetical protein VIV60_19575 [Polyangiaceae bacterium]